MNEKKYGQQNKTENYRHGALTGFFTKAWCLAIYVQSSHASARPQYLPITWPSRDFPPEQSSVKALSVCVCVAMRMCVCTEISVRASKYNLNNIDFCYIVKPRFPEDRTANGAGRVVTAWRRLPFSGRWQPDIDRRYIVRGTFNSSVQTPSIADKSFPLLVLFSP